MVKDYILFYIGLKYSKYKYNFSHQLFIRYEKYIHVQKKNDKCIDTISLVSMKQLIIFSIQEDWSPK